MQTRWLLVLFDGGIPACLGTNTADLPEEELGAIYPFRQRWKHRPCCIKPYPLLNRVYGEIGLDSLVALSKTALVAPSPSSRHIITWSELSESPPDSQRRAQPLSPATVSWLFSCCIRDHARPYGRDIRETTWHGLAYGARDGTVSRPTPVLEPVTIAVLPSERGSSTTSGLQVSG